MQCPQCEALEKSWVHLGREYVKALDAARGAKDWHDESMYAADIARTRMKEAEAVLADHRAKGHGYDVRLVGPSGGES